MNPLNSICSIQAPRISEIGPQKSIDIPRAMQVVRSGPKKSNIGLSKVQFSNQSNPSRPRLYEFGIQRRSDTGVSRAIFLAIGELQVIEFRTSRLWHCTLTVSFCHISRAQVPFPILRLFPVFLSLG